MSALIPVEADGGHFLAETRGDHIHSSRLAALNDMVVSSLLADQPASVIGVTAEGALGAESSRGYGGERLRRAKGDLSCGHLVFCDETGLQAFTAVSMCIYLALAKTAVDYMGELARSGAQNAPLRAAHEIKRWGLYPLTERVVFMLAFADYHPPPAVMTQMGWTTAAPFQANPAVDPPWFTPLNEYLAASTKLNEIDPTGQQDAVGSYGMPRYPEQRWKVDYWIEALTQIVVMNRKTTPTPDDQQKMADAFNGRVGRDDDGRLIIEEAPRYNVLIANQIAYEGIDLQTRTCALHHLDLPWEPATYTQRNGRAVRQGNVLSHVSIQAYLTEGTVDFYKLGRLEGRRAWLATILSSTGGADAPIGGMSAADRDAITLACTLPEDRPDVARRLKEQQAALRERTLVTDFVQNQQSCSGLNHAAIEWHLPMVMDPRDAFIHRGVDHVPLAKALALMQELEAQRIALDGMRNSNPEGSIPAFAPMKATAVVRTVPALDALKATQGMVQDYQGGGRIFTPESPAMWDPEDPAPEPAVVEEAGRSIVTSFCEGSVLRYQRKDGTEAALWTGYIYTDGQRQQWVYLPVMRDDVIYGWRRVSREKAARNVLRRLDSSVLPTITPNVEPESPDAPATGSILACFAAGVASTQTQDAGYGGFKKDEQDRPYFPLFGARWYVPPGVTASKANPLAHLYVVDYPARFIEHYRTGLRTLYMATLWHRYTNPASWRFFAQPSAWGTGRDAGRTPFIAELFTVDGGAVSSRPFVDGGDVSGASSLKYAFRVTRLSDNMGSRADALLHEPDDHVVEWKSRVVTPDVVDVSVTLAALFLRSMLLREFGDDAPDFAESDYDPGIATVLRARLEGMTGSEPIPMLAEGSQARALYDDATVTAEGVSFGTVGRVDAQTGIVGAAVWGSLDAFLDAFRDPENNRLVIDGWPAPRFFRLLLTACFTDLRDYTTLARGSKPLPGASRDAIRTGVNGLAWRGHARWTEELLLLNSARAKADYAQRQARQRAQAEQRRSQGHLFDPKATPKQTKRSVMVSRLLRWFKDAKAQKASPNRVVFRHDDKLWLPLEVRLNAVSGLVNVDAVPIKRGPGFGQDKDAFLRYVEQVGGNGVYKDLQAGKPAVVMDTSNRTTLVMDPSDLLNVIG